MIPGTLLGLVALAAALGPGFVFVRRAERHNNRPSQSQLSELVEMVVIGGALSLVAAGVVLTAVDITDCIETAELRADPAEYILNEPLRIFLAAGLFYGLAYAGAYLMARITYRDSSAVIEPGVTGWGHAFWKGLPDKETPVLVTVELKDGRRVTGGLASFTVGSEENREIVLVQPLAATAKPGTKGVPMHENFVVLREDQIAVLSGTYVTEGPPPAR